MTFQLGEAVDPALLVGERWFAAPGPPIRSITVHERFDIPVGGALAILRVEVQDGRVLWRTMPIETGDGQAPWLGLLELVATTGALRGHAGSALTGHPEPGFRGEAGRVVRPLGKDQSHTTVVVDNAVLLKLYRALASGPNTEVELGQALARDRTAPVPPFLGALRLRRPGAGGREERLVVGFVQAFVPDAGDAFEELADRLAAFLRAGAPQRALRSLLVDAAPAGRAAARLHAALASIPRRQFAPRPMRSDHVEHWRPRATRALRLAPRAVRAVDPTTAAWLTERRPDIERALAPLGSPRSVTLQRIHADLHLGQLLRHGDDFLLADLEGEPGRSVAERRRPDTPLRDVASMLRSFDHVARSGMRRSGVPLDDVVAGTSAADPAIEAWLAAVRLEFLGAYESEAAARGLPVALDPDLLHALEVEKELSEFAYAATYLPAWMYAPSAGMRWLLDRGPALRGI